MSERDALRNQLYGVNSHLNTIHALEGITAKTVGSRPNSAEHTIFQILQHMVFWQDITLARLRGESPETPASAEGGWAAAAAPEDPSEWQAAVACLDEGLRSIEVLLASPKFDLDGLVARETNVTAREEILTIQGHNSYHIGQIVTLRRELGAWPPPRGGDTW